MVRHVPMWIRNSLQKLRPQSFSADQIELVVDRPKPDQLFSAWLDVQGWAVAPIHVEVAVKLLVSGRCLRELTTTIPRPDVAARYPTHPFAFSSGFESRLMRDELPERDRFTLEVVAHAPGIAGRLRSAGRKLAIPVRRHQQAEIPHARGDFAAAWDAHAISMDDARTAVCGSRDIGEYQRSGEATAGSVIDLAGVRPDDEVLEIGCGTGRVGAVLARKCGRWIGSDVSENMLRHAAGALEALPNVAFQRLNGFDLRSFANDSLDVVYCTGVFMHLDEWDRYRYVVEAFRILRPGGRVYYDNFNLLSEEGWALFLGACDLDPAARPDSISKSSTPDELRTYAERAGFEDITLHTNALWVTVVARKPGAPPSA
jgi:SAM-dependent methyltransferase